VAVAMSKAESTRNNPGNLEMAITTG